MLDIPRRVQHGSGLVHHGRDLCRRQLNLDPQGLQDIGAAALAAHGAVTVLGHLQTGRCGHQGRRRRDIKGIKSVATGTDDINHRLLGKKVEVLLEEKHKGRWKGRTRTNKLVFFEPAGDDHDWRGKRVNVEITWTGPWSMQASLPEERPLAETLEGYPLEVL